MSRFFDKIKNSLKAWVLLAGVSAEFKYNDMLEDAVERGDLHTLRKGLDVPEASYNPLAASTLELRKRSVINACQDRATFKTARQVMTMGYGDIISRDDQRKMLAKILLHDEDAFGDSEAISFCQKMELPIDLEKDGKHLSRQGKICLENFLTQSYHSMRDHDLMKNPVVIPTPQVLQKLSEVCVDQKSTDGLVHCPRGLSIRLYKTMPKRDAGQYPRHNPKYSGR